MKTTNWWWNMKSLKNQDICFFVFFFLKSNIKWIDAYINDVKPFKLYTLFYDLEPKTKSKKKRNPQEKIKIIEKTSQIIEEHWCGRHD